MTAQHVVAVIGAGGKMGLRVSDNLQEVVAAFTGPGPRELTSR